MFLPRKKKEEKEKKKLTGRTKESLGAMGTRTSKADCRKRRGSRRLFPILQRADLSQEEAKKMFKGLEKQKKA